MDLPDDTATKCAEEFAQWTASLAEDARIMASALREEWLPDNAKRTVAGALNYLVKSLDLIPDGVEDLGFLDDASVLRMAARIALHRTPGLREGPIREGMERMRDGVPVLEKVLGDGFSRLESYVTMLEKGAGDGRTVDEILNDEKTRMALVNDVNAWANQYSPPRITAEPLMVVKFRSFLLARLG